MKRIAVSQRVDIVPDCQERRDALDVRLCGLLWSLGLVPVPLCSSINDHASYLNELKPDGFVLSGGNDIGTIPERDRLEFAALEYAEKHKLPVLGICRGLQIINHYQGGSLIKVVNHAGIRHGLKGKLLKLSDEVNSYHNYGVTVETLGKNLEPFAFAMDDTVEALRHRTLPWLALMWHPERDYPLQDNDLELVKQHFGGKT